MRGETILKNIGVISDIHGNLPALQAALDYLKQQRCEQIIHTGDVVDIGPNSKECLQLLVQNNVLCLLGNHDRDFLINRAEHNAMSHVSAAHKRFVFESLDGFQNVVAKFPLCETRVLGGKKVLFQHYCLFPGSSLNRLFMTIENNPSAEKFDIMYDGCDCDAVFFGHKHEPCDIAGKRLYVDVGSVGCHPDPYAKGIVISYDSTHFGYRRFAVPYDVGATKNAMADLPDGQYLYDFYFLHKANMPDISG